MLVSSPCSCVDRHLWVWALDAHNVLAWGDDSGTHRLGLGVCMDTSAGVYIPCVVQALESHDICISQVVAGDTHSFAVTDSGMLYAWGFNTCHQLGFRDTRPCVEPTIVSHFQEKGFRVSAVATCKGTTIVLLRPSAIPPSPSHAHAVPSSVSRPPTPSTLSAQPPSLTETQPTHDHGTPPRRRWTPATASDIVRAAMATPFQFSTQALSAPSQDAQYARDATRAPSAAATAPGSAGGPLSRLETAVACCVHLQRLASAYCPGVLPRSHGTRAARGVPGVASSPSSTSSTPALNAQACAGEGVAPSVDQLYLPLPVVHASMMSYGAPSPRQPRSATAREPTSTRHVKHAGQQHAAASEANWSKDAGVPTMKGAPTDVGAFHATPVASAAPAATGADYLAPGAVSVARPYAVFPSAGCIRDCSVLISKCLAVATALARQLLSGSVRDADALQNIQRAWACSEVIMLCLLRVLKSNVYAWLHARVLCQTRGVSSSNPTSGRGNPGAGSADHVPGLHRAAKRGVWWAQPVSFAASVTDAGLVHAHVLACEVVDYAASVAADHAALLSTSTPACVPATGPAPGAKCSGVSLPEALKVGGCDDEGSFPSVWLCGCLAVLGVSVTPLFSPIVAQMEAVDVLRVGFDVFYPTAASRSCLLTSLVATLQHGASTSAGASVDPAVAGCLFERLSQVRGEASSSLPRVCENPHSHVRQSQRCNVC